jgi:hypothetical protein
MPTARNRRERYIKWIMQVIDGIDEPFSTRDILNNWDDYAPVRYKPQMTLLGNLIKQMVAKGLIVQVDKEKVKRTFSGTYYVPLFVRVVEEE